jgi:hypothetical protein
MLPHDTLHPFPIDWNTETASGDRSDHACPIRRMMLRDLDELGISPRRHTRSGLDRAATRNLMDRLPAHTGHTSAHQGSTSVGDHGAGSGHTDAHVQSRKSSPRPPMRRSCDPTHAQDAPPTSSDPAPRARQPVSRSDDATRPCRPPRADPATGTRGSRKSRAPGTHPEHCDHPATLRARSESFPPASTNAAVSFRSFPPLTRIRATILPNRSGERNRQPHTRVRITTL